MAEITSDMVKQLRDATQAGMMDCKKARRNQGRFRTRKITSQKEEFLKPTRSPVEKPERE